MYFAGIIQHMYPQIAYRLEKLKKMDFFLREKEERDGGLVDALFQGHWMPVFTGMTGYLLRHPVESRIESGTGNEVQSLFLYNTPGFRRAPE
jgi:hypothetical protein